MKSAFRVGTPTGTVGAQQVYLSSLAGHPGVVKNFYFDLQFQGRNNAAAVSPVQVRTGRGAGGTGIPITSTWPFIAGSAGVAFPSAFPEQPLGTTGNDDGDNILNGLFGSVIQIFNVGVGRIIFDQYTAVTLRTLLGALNGGYDIQSRNLIDYPINFPSSGSGTQLYNLGLSIPLSLDDYIAGGEVFAQGTDSMRDGTFQVNFGGTVTTFINAAGATINVTSFVPTLYANYMWEGDGSWVGPTWRATRQAYGGNNPMLKPGHYMWISDSSTQTAATVGGAGFNATTVTLYNFHGQWNGDQVSPAALRYDWSLNRNKYGNMYDVGERTVPIITMDINDELRRLPQAKMAQTIDASSGAVTNIVLMIVEAIEKNPGIVASVAAIKGGGGATTDAHPSVATHDPEASIPAGLMPFYPTVQVAGAVAGGTVNAGPTKAAINTANRNIAGFANAAQKRGGR
jgi:hypothetical protein